MTPAKQKADELIEKFRKHAEGCIPFGDSEFIFNQEAQTEAAKACALICVEYLINEELSPQYDAIQAGENIKSFWQQVKTSLQNE